MKRTGKVQVYTGDGKGKTTASLGLALRAIGQGYKVFMIQFMKGGAYTGEFVAASNYLPNFSIAQYGRHCIKQQKQMKIKGFFSLSKSEQKNKLFDYIRDDIECGTCRFCFLNDDVQRDYCEEALKHAMEIVSSGEHELVILDEINVAVQIGLLKPSHILNLISKKPSHVELVLTGRGASPEIIAVADLVTEMKLHKHYFDDGVNARRGIEY
ncbi:cob(I)yrinic acid a,c-diamide adenosyltransferase [archaeon]|nr:cob(I)yrinic acid a,c-diamide adenosyltransferase [archaeon]